MADGGMSDSQHSAVDAMRPRRSLLDRVVSFLSGEFPVDVGGLPERERGYLADHLEESARRALSVQTRMDALMFGLTMEEAEFTTPAVDMLRAVAAAVRAGDGAAPVVAGLDTPQRYGVSGLLEAARNRAESDGAPHAVGEGCARLWQAWDRWAGVSGSPAERSWRLAGSPQGVVVD